MCYPTILILFLCEYECVYFNICIFPQLYMTSLCGLYFMGWSTFLVFNFSKTTYLTVLHPFGLLRSFLGASHTFKDTKILKTLFSSSIRKCCKKTAKTAIDFNHRVNLIAKKYCKPMLKITNFTPPPSKKKTFFFQKKMNIRVQTVC